MQSQNLLSQIKRFVLWMITPIQKFLQRTGRQEAKITSKAVNYIFEQAQEGDILVCYESGRPTSKLIKGIYDHAVILSSEGKIIEAVGDRFVDKVNVGGVREVDFIKWLYQVDGVALIRPSLPEYLRNKAAMSARKYIGVSYDYTFSYGSEKIYCSELPYLCYRTDDINFMKDIGKDEEILPQEYRDRCGKDFILIYEFKGG